MNSFVFDFAVTDKLTYILQHDLGINTGLGADNSQWYGINQYLQYQLNDCWAIGGRFEWFRDDDGARISTNGNGRGQLLRVDRWPELATERQRDRASGSPLRLVRRNRRCRRTAVQRRRRRHQFSGGFDLIFTF